jgi:uncharacterized protein YjiS (DUF1127 family)
MTTETHPLSASSLGMTSRFGAFIAAVKEWLSFRNTFNLLDELDDNALRDVGLTRDDLIDLRLATSFADTLANIKRRRQGGW